MPKRTPPGAKEEEFDWECLIIGCKSTWSAEVTLERVVDKEQFVLRLCDDCADYLSKELAKGEVN